MALRGGPSDVVSSGAEEGDFESDSDGASALAPRRRRASDDESGRAGEGPRGSGGSTRTSGDAGVVDAASSVEDDGSRVDGPPYSDEDGDAEEGPLIDDDEDDEEDEDDGGVMVPRRRRKGSDEEDDEDTEDEDDDEDLEGGSLSDPRKNADTDAGAARKDVAGDDKKDAEPFVVPTTGAFYMHDDRFRDSGGARPRRSLGGRKLWEAKDEKPWVHDMFEELNVRDDHYAKEASRRGGRGGGRGRGRGRARGRGGARTFIHDESANTTRGRRGRGRGRGAKSEYQGRGVDTGSALSNNDTVRTSDDVGTAEKDATTQVIKQVENVPSKKPQGGSHLSSASPPFFPSGTLQTKEVSKDEVNKRVQGKVRDGQGPVGARTFSSRTLSSSGAIYVSKSASPPGKTTVTGQNLVSPGLVPKTSPGTQQSGKAPQSVSMLQQLQQNAQFQGNSAAPPASHSTTSQQYSKGVSHAQAGIHIRPQHAQNQSQIVSQTQGQSGSARISATKPNMTGTGSSSQTASSHFKAVTGSRGGRGGSPSLGRGQFVYNNGAGSAMRIGEPGYVQPVGPVALQYTGQSQGGITVPTVGMAIPNYAGQPPYGFANSEVTWVPVIAQGGGVGGGFNSPYIALDGAPTPMYYAQPSAQTASYRPTGRGELLSGSKLWKPPPSPDLGTDEFGQRHSKPRRYSEMSFGQ